MTNQETVKTQFKEGVILEQILVKPKKVLQVHNLFISSQLRGMLRLG